jgi:NAD(P)H-dependent FMN reductase
MGSIRAARHCDTLTTWAIDIARSGTQAGIIYEKIDLKDWPLPMDDEPGIPALGVYAQAHTQAWSEKVRKADGFVWVTPQYNWGYPAPLKNALDHLYDEWRGKPVVIVTYGGHGGSKCAGQLKQVAGGLKMRVMPIQPQITLTDAMIKGGAMAPGSDFARYRRPLLRAFAKLEAFLAKS